VVLAYTVNIELEVMFIRYARTIDAQHNADNRLSIEFSASIIHRTSTSK